MSPRSNAELALLERRLGADLGLVFAGTAGLFEDADLLVADGRSARTVRDLGTVSGVAAAEQMLVNRLMTRRGELAPLGHPEYGSRHHEYIGEPNVDRTRMLVKLAVLEALGAEPRVEKVVAIRVYAPHEPPRDQIRIEADVRLVEHEEPLNHVVPI